MRKILITKFCLLLPVFLCSSVLTARESPAGLESDSQYSDQLYSTSVSRKFFELACDLANSEDATYIENEQAIVFLRAALELDYTSQEIRSFLIKCACKYPELNSLGNNGANLGHFELVYRLLQEYVDKDANLDIAHKGVQYLLSQVKSPVQKETLLDQLLQKFATKNPVFGSELATILGMLKAQNEIPQLAERYFSTAYRNDKYNRLAFENLVQLVPKKIQPYEYLENLRYAIRENPVDLQRVLEFAQLSERFQLYDAASDAYEYSSELFKYLYPYEPLPADIYIPWSISCYNSRLQTMKCLEIAEQIRKSGKFDLALEALAGRAAMKLGEDKIADKIIGDAEKKALNLLDTNSQNVTEAQMAWFYSFVIPVYDDALLWANKARVAEPNSPAAASLFAYALVQKQEYDAAISIINHFERNQISELALARTQLEQDQMELGIETLKKSIARDPGSFAAERGKTLLAQYGQKYEPPENYNTILAELGKSFGKKIVPEFIEPEKRLSASFNIRNKELAFGEDLDCAVSIVNKSPEPMIISDSSMFEGNIRVDAVISGDLSKTIPNLVSTRIRKAAPIEPGRSMIVNLKLVTGRLREVLMAYPQATLNINFILYLDPEITANNKVTNRLTHIAPVSTTIKRPGIVITGQYLRSRVDVISTGTKGQKIQSAQLFISLLKEQNAMAERKTPYSVVFSGDMNVLLEQALIYDSGLLRNPDNGGWVVKVYTLAELLSLPLDYDLVEAVSENLNNKKWPIRLMALYLLAEKQGGKFNKVLEFISENETEYPLVREMAKTALLKSGITGQNL